MRHSRWPICDRVQRMKESKVVIGPRGVCAVRIRADLDLLRWLCSRDTGLSAKRQHQHLDGSCRNACYTQFGKEGRRGKDAIRPADGS